VDQEWLLHFANEHNSLGSWDVFLSLFSSLTEGPPANIVLLQDPPSSKGFLPSFSGFKSFAPPIARPRVACYISQKFLQEFAVLPFFPSETDDFMAPDVFTPRGCFGSKFPCFRIGTSYARSLPPAPHSVFPESSLLDIEYSYLVAGDFNIDNSATDPSRLLSSKEAREFAPYFDRATDLGFTFLNTPGIYTRFPFMGPTDRVPLTWLSLTRTSSPPFTLGTHRPSSLQDQTIPQS